MKYTTCREKADGSKTYTVNPPKLVRQALGIKAESFPCPTMAEQYLNDFLVKYDEFKLNSRTKDIVANASSVSDLVAEYKESAHFTRRLAESSRYQYDFYLRLVCGTPFSGKQTAGDLYAANVSTGVASAILERIELDRNSHSAFHAAKVMRQMWRLAIRAEKVQANPWSDHGIPKPGARTVTWSAAQVAQAISHCDTIGLRSLGTMIDLCYTLCQHPGDMRQLTVGMIRGDAVYLTQQKTGVDMALWLPDALLERLAPHIEGRDADEPLLVCERTSRPYDGRFYNKLFAQVRNELGWNEALWVGDLRSTGATEMAHSGVTEDEIMAVTGHLDRNTLAHYIIHRRNTDLSKAAGKKRFG